MVTTFRFISRRLQVPKHFFLAFTTSRNHNGTEYEELTPLMPFVQKSPGDSGVSEPVSEKQLAVCQIDSPSELGRT